MFLPLFCAALGCPAIRASERERSTFPLPRRCHLPWSGDQSHKRRGIASRVSKASVVAALKCCTALMGEGKKEAKPNSRVVLCYMEKVVGCSILLFADVLNSCSLQIKTATKQGIYTHQSNWGNMAGYLIWELLDFYPLLPDLILPLSLFCQRTFSCQ